MRYPFEIRSLSIFGYRTIKTIKKGALSQFTRSSLGALGKLTWEELVADGHIIAGSPETVVRQMQELITGLKVGNIFCLLHIGDMPNEKTRLSTRLFAEEVMPKLRNMWPEWEDDERFWIHPLETPVQTTAPLAAMGEAAQ